MSKTNSKTTTRIRRSQGLAAVRVQPLVRQLRQVLTSRDQEIDEAACMLHNVGATLAGNTQSSDIEWLARWLYRGSNFGMGSVDTMQWSLSNDEFEKLTLTPDRPWTEKRWETLDDSEREAWQKLARMCLYALPHIAERIGDRFIEQAKALRIVQRANRGELSNAEVSEPPTRGANRDSGTECANGGSLH